MTTMHTLSRFRNCRDAWRADGQSYVETVENAEKVIDEWIETAKDLGREVPKPKGKLAYA